MLLGFVTGHFSFRQMSVLVSLSHAPRYDISVEIL